MSKSKQEGLIQGLRNFWLKILSHENSQDLLGQDLIDNVNKGLDNLERKFAEYYPEEKFLQAFEEFTNDKHFKKPTKRSEKEQKEPIDEIDYENLLIFLGKDNIRKRFSLFGFAKALAEVINEAFPPEEKGSEAKNSLKEHHDFLHGLWKIVEHGIDNIKYSTFKMKGLRNPSSFSVVHSKKLIKPYLKEVEGYNESIELLEKEMGTIKKAIDLQDFGMSFDISIWEKEIFRGILDDFGVTKTFRGKESRRYKIALLKKLFIISHPELIELHPDDFAKELSPTEKRAILKLVDSPDKNSPLKK